MGCATSTPQITSDDKLNNTYKRARLSQNLVQQTNKVDPMTKYEICKQIGIGSMGCVSTVRAKNNDDDDNDTNNPHLYAMKTLRPGRMTREFIAELKNEIRSIRRLDHPNIVRFHEVYYTEKQISIIMDYCGGGDLYGRMPYTEAQAAAIMSQVLTALGYMHLRGYVHLDIKCENIMFTSAAPDAPVKVIDFGFAQHLGKDALAHKQLGTFDTMAPEVFGGNYNTQADVSNRHTNSLVINNTIVGPCFYSQFFVSASLDSDHVLIQLWSAGVVAFELISGKKPFAAASAMGVLGKVTNGEIPMNDKKWKAKSAASKAFVKALIKRDPKERLDADRALKHKWIRERSTAAAPVGHARSKSMSTIGDTIIKYGQAPTLKKIGLLMIAHKTFPEEVVKMQQQFAWFDTKHTGIVTFEDFQKVLHDINQEYSHDDILQIFQSLDTYENGQIAYTEFVAAMLEKYVHLTEHRIDDAFDRIDVTNSGYISVDDLRLVLGKDFTDEKAKEIISQIDFDGDGQGKLRLPQNRRRYFNPGYILTQLHRFCSFA